MTTEQKIRWAIIAGQGLMLALLIPLAIWLGAVLPGDEQSGWALAQLIAGLAP